MRKVFYNLLLVIFIFFLIIGSNTLYSQKLVTNKSPKPKSFQSDPTFTTAKHNHGFEFGKQRGFSFQFIEDPQKHGYPIGWATNSQRPILLLQGKASSLNLEESESGVYLSKYVRVQSGKKYILSLSFINNSDIQLIISEYSTRNKKGKELLLQALPFGDHEEFQVSLNLLPTTENLLISLEKRSTGQFSLEKFSLNEVGKSK